MKVESIKSNVLNGGVSSLGNQVKPGITCNANYSNISQHNISFGSNMSKHAMYHFRKLSNYMKEPTEMTNALIAMIGTGFIAPFAIMCSPKKKCKNSQDEKADRDKKMFQALRQPVSAFLAFAFQVPTTVGIARLFDYLAFKKQLNLFKDNGPNGLGAFIPNKNYLIREAKRALSENADPQLKSEWAAELKITENLEKLRDEFKKQIAKEYREVGIEISAEKLDKLAHNEKRFRNFVAAQVSKKRYENLLAKKIEEFGNNNFKIEDLDLVTPKYQSLAKQKYKAEFKELRKKAKLSIFDKILRAMGLSNKKLNELSKAEKQLAKEKGLILMKTEVDKGVISDYFKNSSSRLSKYIKDRNAKAQKLYANKIFWLSLVSNLVMVAISCEALNWLHPKFAEFVHKMKGKNNQENTPSTKKVEVKA